MSIKSEHFKIFKNPEYMLFKPIVSISKQNFEVDSSILSTPK